MHTARHRLGRNEQTAHLCCGVACETADVFVRGRQACNLTGVNGYAGRQGPGRQLSGGDGNAGRQGTGRELRGGNSYAGRQSTSADLRSRKASRDLIRADAHATRQSLNMTR
jgi:hypothetical protein